MRRLQTSISIGLRERETAEPFAVEGVVVAILIVVVVLVVGGGGTKVTLARLRTSGSPRATSTSRTPTTEESSTLTEDRERVSSRSLEEEPPSSWETRTMLSAMLILRPSGCPPEVAEEHR